MDKLMNEMDNLISEIDNCKIINTIKEIEDKVYNDKELMSLLDKYKINPNDKLKTEIISNSLFQEYKIKETDLNIFIMEINKRLKTINEKGLCNHENN